MSSMPNPFGPKVCICPAHMSRMKNAVKDSGLWHRVSQSTEVLHARLAQNDPYDPDPMLLVHGMIMGKCRHTAAMNTVQLWDQCPVCYFDVAHWIDEAAVAVKVRIAKLDVEKIEDQERSREIERLQR